MSNKLFQVEKVAADATVDARGIIRTLWDGRKTTCPLNITVIGCGLGGLAAAYCLGQAGHHVTLLEAASALGEVGAGIQVSPNVSRLLIRWGLKENLDKIAVRPESITFKRWDNGETVGATDWSHMEEDYGAPYYQIHRADFHKLLFHLALPFMTLRLSSQVVDIDVYSESPSCTLSNGESIKSDVIIGADGVKSHTRELVVGGPDRPRPTGDAAYRCIVDAEQMLADPELKSFIEHPELISWMGPEKHVIGYNIRANREYNLVVLHPDNEEDLPESWTSEGSADKMRAEFQGWDPKLQAILKLVPRTLSWKLMDRAPMETWLHKCGTIVLLGDSCHPMLPYRAQGAAMAIEDAAVLGNMFSRLSDRRMITPMLRAYEGLRHARASATQAASRMNQKIFHYPDGPEQSERDKRMREAWEIEKAIKRGELTAPDDDATQNSPNQWADTKKSRNQFAYDADAIVDGWWKGRGQGEMEAYCL